MTWCSEDSATPRFVLASSAIRCRFVDRFVRLRVLSRVSRQRFSSHDTLFPRSGPGESSSPMSQVILRCYDFPPRIPVTYWFRFRGPRYPPRFVSRSLRSRSRKDGGGLPGQGQCSSGDPIAGLLSRGRERDLPGFQAIPPVLLPRSTTPAESTIPCLLTVSSMLPPLG
jgi:hypothetical protein